MSITNRARANIASFVHANEEASRVIARALPQAQVDLQTEYSRVAATYLARLGPGSVVLDVGAGKVTPFASTKPAGVCVIGIDVSAEQMEGNDALDEKVVADVTAGLPFADASVDVITSRAVLEHSS